MSVVIGHIHDEDVDARFYRSMMSLVRHRDIEDIVYCESGGGGLDKGRNVVVQKFLQTTTAEWLLQIDTDMYFGLDEYDRLLATAEDGRDIVSGIYMANERPPRAAWHRWDHEGHAKSMDASEFYEGEVVDVDGCGGGFLIVNRRVFEKMDHPDEYLGRGGSWFTQNEIGPAGQLLNEDSSFCRRAQAHGYRIAVDTGCFVGHMKRRVLGWEP